MDICREQLDDEPAKDTHFYEVLRCWVGDPLDALRLAATHRTHADEIRRGKPAVIDSFQDRSRFLALESGAWHHEEVAAVCERHAARLQAADAAA